MESILLHRVSTTINLHFSLFVAKSTVNFCTEQTFWLVYTTRILQYTYLTQVNRACYHVGLYHQCTSPL